jgi:thiol-disulfide isomerase/thioredoxin
MYSTYDKLGVKPTQNTDQYSVLELKTQEERIQLIQSTKVVCIDIYADWCGPCIQTAPAYSVLATKYNKPGMCAMVKLNWNNVSAEERKNITGIPLFVFYLDGQVLPDKNVIGADLKEVEAKLNEVLNLASISPDNNKGPRAGRNTIRSTKQGGPQPFEENNQYAAQQDSYTPQPHFPQGGMAQGGMQQQGMANQGMPQQTMPQQEYYGRGPVNQERFQRGMPNQQMPNQQMPQQGMANQGMPNQAMHNQTMAYQQPGNAPQYGQLNQEHYQRGGPQGGLQGAFRQQNVQYYQ